LTKKNLAGLTFLNKNKKVEKKSKKMKKIGATNLAIEGVTNYE
jgi:hypothetical protein